MQLPQIDESGKTTELQEMGSQQTGNTRQNFPIIEPLSKPFKRKAKILSPRIGILGALIFGFGTLGFVLFQTWLENKFMSDIQVDIVPHSELNQIEKVIDPNLGDQAFREAKSCTVPLIYAAVKLAPGHFVQTFRIRSGDYLSPPIVVTEVPQRVPFPVPGPYQLGYGTIGLEGQFDGVQIWRVSQVWGDALNSAINKSLGFHWTPGPPC